MSQRTERHPRKWKIDSSALTIADYLPPAGELHLQGTQFVPVYPSPPLYPLPPFAANEETHGARRFLWKVLDLNQPQGHHEVVFVATIDRGPGPPGSRRQMAGYLVIRRGREETLGAWVAHDEDAKPGPDGEG